MLYLWMPPCSLAPLWPAAASLAPPRPCLALAVISCLCVVLGKHGVLGCGMTGACVPGPQYCTFLSDEGIPLPALHLSLRPLPLAIGALLFLQGLLQVPHGWESCGICFPSPAPCCLFTAPLFVTATLASLDVSPCPLFGHFLEQVQPQQERQPAVWDRCPSFSPDVCFYCSGSCCLQLPRPLLPTHFKFFYF